MGANVGVFWDINDFPIPDYLDSYAFYEDVKTNLREKGFTGSFSLHLYADGDPYMPARLVNRFQCPELGVSYIPSGVNFCYLKHFFFFNVLANFSALSSFVRW